MQTEQIQAGPKEEVQEGKPRRQKILLVGRPFNLAFYLLQRFPDWQADFCFASTCQEACDQLKQQSFDLVLSDYKLPDGWASQMIPHLEGSRANLFCLQMVEAGCWWLPLARAGMKCDMAPALRRSEFFQLLREQMESPEELHQTGDRSAREATVHCDVTLPNGRKEPIREQCS